MYYVVWGPLLLVDTVLCQSQVSVADECPQEVLVVRDVVHWPESSSDSFDLFDDVCVDITVQLDCGPCCTPMRQSERRTSIWGSKV